MISRRNIVGTTVPAVDDCCEVKWSSGEVLMATVLAAGKCDKSMYKWLLYVGVHYKTCP
jgi:hypothetical protein